METVKIAKLGFLKAEDTCLVSKAYSLGCLLAALYKQSKSPNFRLEAILLGNNQLETCDANIRFVIQSIENLERQDGGQNIHQHFRRGFEEGSGLSYQACHPLIMKRCI